MVRALITETEMRAAMDRLPPELHRLLAWLVTGSAPSGSARNGTA